MLLPAQVGDEGLYLHFSRQGVDLRHLHLDGRRIYATAPVMLKPPNAHLQGPRICAFIMSKEMQ